MGYAFARATRSSKYIRRGRRHLARTCNVLFSFVQSVRVVGIRKRSGPPRILPVEERSLFHEGIQVAFENRSAASAAQVNILVSKSDQKRAGCTITRMRLRTELETGRAPKGAFKVLLELLSVHPQLPGGAPPTMRRARRADGTCCLGVKRSRR